MEHDWVAIYPEGRSDARRTLNLDRIETSQAEIASDTMLVRQAQEGQPEALETLLHRHSEDLMRYCCYLVSRHEDAEDVHQEALTRAISSLSSLRDVSSFRGWLFAIARNLAVDVARHRSTVFPLLNEDAIPAPRHCDTPLDRAEVGEEHDTVAQALTKLTISHQKILYLREVDGLSYAQIARKLDISSSAVETLLLRARRRLRDEYARSQGPICSVASVTS